MTLAVPLATGLPTPLSSLSDCDSDDAEEEEDDDEDEEQLDEDEGRPDGLDKSTLSATFARSGRWIYNSMNNHSEEEKTIHVLVSEKKYTVNCSHNDPVGTPLPED